MGHFREKWPIFFCIKLRLTHSRKNKSSYVVPFFIPRFAVLSNR